MRLGKGTWDLLSTDTNTTALIDAWSMDGARTDLETHFGSPVDIIAAVAARGDDAGSESRPRSGAPSPLLVKAAGDSDWAQLPVGVLETS